MFQDLKEAWRSNLWEAMGKLDHHIPEGYEYPIVSQVYHDLPSLAFPINTADYRRRSRAVLSDIVERTRLGGDPSYMRSQAWNLVIKMVNRGYQDLARALDLELEGLDVLF
jgi:hypothetical protein